MVIADKKDCKFLDYNRPSEYWNLKWEIVDYDNISKCIEKLKTIIALNDINLLMYSRNDQVANRTSIGKITKKLKIGYSSFSGIDDGQRNLQMIECFKDFISPSQALNFYIRTTKNETNFKDSVGTFSLLFDTEQLGCVRYGLPRILDLLSQYNIHSTFFLTNFIKQIYPNILHALIKNNHEIGIHGFYHEYLTGLTINSQTAAIKKMLNDFDVFVSGTNFIGRMDEKSIDAFVINGLKYFVFDNINYYRFISYPKISTEPYRLDRPGGIIWAIPIVVETYNLPWFSVKGMIDSALLQGIKYKFPHLTILCHPFRDGNLRNIKLTEQLILYLLGKGLRPITLNSLILQLDNSRSSLFDSELKKSFLDQRLMVSLPATKQDLLDMIPQNLVLANKMINRNKTLF